MRVTVVGRSARRLGSPELQPKRKGDRRARRRGGRLSEPRIQMPCSILAASQQPHTYEPAEESALTVAEIRMGDLSGHSRSDVPIKSGCEPCSVSQICVLLSAAGWLEQPTTLEIGDHASAGSWSSSAVRRSPPGRSAWRFMLPLRSIVHFFGPGAEVRCSRCDVLRKT
jgi:hypothetical protein